MVLERVRPDASNPSPKDIRTLRNRLQGIIRRFIDLQAFPGASLAVGCREKLLICRGYGRLDYTSTSPPANPRSVYDLASLTKVVCTTTLAMQACERGMIDLEDRLGRYFPEFQADGKQQVRLKHLLAHSSGLPAHIPLYRQANGKACIPATDSATSPGTPARQSERLQRPGLHSAGGRRRENTGRQPRQPGSRTDLPAPGNAPDLLPPPFRLEAPHRAH